MARGHSRSPWLGYASFLTCHYAFLMAMVLTCQYASLWGLPLAMVVCLLCSISSGFSISTTKLCYKCQNRRLQHENYKLRRQLDSILLRNNELLDLKYYQKLLSESAIQTDEPIQLEIQLDIPLTSLKFITITFDPSKFGVNNQVVSERQYILYQLMLLVKKGFIDSFYGCFEFHHNGATHAHVITHLVRFDIPLIKLLRPAFTDNPQNKVAVRVDPARMPQAIQYVNKVDKLEGKGYFSYDLSILNPVIDPLDIIE